MRILKTLTAIVLVSLLTRAFSAMAPVKVYSEGDMVTDSKQTYSPVPYNRVHRAGLFWLNVTNTGYFGNPDTTRDPCTGRLAVSGELPGGSGTDFLFVGAIQFGGYLDSISVNINGTDATAFQGPLVTTSFEGWEGSPMPKECWPVNFDENPDGKKLGKIVETSNVEGRISCLFEEVYDPLATAEEQFTLMYSDKFVQQNPYTGMDSYDRRQHIPLGIEVRQKSYAWSYDYAQKFVIIDYTLFNRNTQGRDIYDFFMGIYNDWDIGMTGGGWMYNHADDLGGFIEKWDKYIDPATGVQKTVELNLAWTADNDGRNYTGQDFYSATGEPGAGKPLDGATSIATVRVLRNPNPNLRYSFNVYVCNGGDEALDWGPRWQTGMHSDWQYDLSKAQLGYDDNNQDGLTNDSNQPHVGGRTEGRPLGDKGKYMIMSNDEFDYNQTAIREVYLNLDEQVDGTPIPQAGKWQKYTTPSDVGQPGFGTIADGTVEKMNDLANGADTKFVLSFGPLGTETTANVAWDVNRDGVFDLNDNVVSNKKVWKFAHGDSLKLTLAFIVNENFHNDLDQDPNYTNNKIIDLNDGLDVTKFAKGWYDALYNVVWAERVYDIPMFDTKVTKFGETKGDGWYGEDVGADGLFGDLKNDTYCWWYNTDPAIAQYPGPDAGEGDFELTTFTTPITDIDGNIAVNEDELLPYGRIAASQDGVYGITGDAENGDRSGYGYMVKYDKEGGLLPLGTWIRYGYHNDRLDVGDGVPDFTGPPPPPSPKIQISFNNNDVIIEWQSHEFFKNDEGFDSYTGPELFFDPFTRVRDFEGYQIQISPDLNSQNYVEVFSVDNINYAYENVGVTGDYYDSPVSADSAEVLLNLGLGIIVREGKIWELRPFGDNRDKAENHSNPGVYTYTVEQVEKTINTTSGTEVVNVNNYKFILHNRLFAEQSYIAVTASDFGDPKTGTPALKSNPAINGMSVIPTKLAGDKNVYVVPNPYRGNINYEAMGWENIDGADTWEEQDRKIVFLNVPLRSVLKIYTLAGDLVKTIAHNGNTRVTERYQYGEYGIAWDLINDNNQAVASGIYLFSVKDVDDDGYEQIGKFVIIK
jgi:hypothetical protein